MLMLLFAGTMLFFTACKTEKAETTTTEEATEQEATTEMSETNEAVDASALPGDTYNIVAEQTSVNWYATKVGGKHNGTVDVKDGFLKVQDGKITGGSFTIDMSSITVLDLDGEWKMKLERHLKGLDQGKEDHFFNIQKHPTATFDITKVTDLEGSENGNAMVYGDLTIKGKTNPVGMTAMVSMMDDQVKVQVQEMIIDRTEWGVNYNSKKIFSDVQDNIIHDDVKFELGLVATKA